MVKLLRLLLLTYKFKDTKPSQKNGGFTLIEVLVGLVLAFLVIIPLLGFMVNIMQTDRQEQAKASSEQDIQAAADYISRDLEQAVYIYDGYGVSKIESKLQPPPAASGDKYVPVLVFWKRQIVPEIIPTANPAQNDDTFVYALVAYYLKINETGCAQSTWSCTAQISRVQYRDSVRVNRAVVRGGEGDPGFELFKPGESSLEDTMNAWPPSGTAPTPKQPEVLIDYIDQTPESPTTLSPPYNLPKASCPAITRDMSKYPAPESSGYTAASYLEQNYGPQQTPPQALLNSKFGNNNQVTGFYACVDTTKTTAQVFIRGNALARLRKKASPPPFVASQSAYFPRTRIQVEGRGLYNPKTTN